MFSIFMELLTKERVSRQYLANKLYCCERSITRYVDRLITDGAPIKSIKGRGGGYELDGIYLHNLRRF